MTGARRILVPVDLSSRSIGAARYAVALGRELNAELVFVHALRNGWPLDDSARKMCDAVRSIQNDGPRRFVFGEGAPASVILDTAAAEHADLILMPTRGATVLHRLIDGSTTARVLREARCPVWAIRDEISTRACRPIRNILCGLSLGPRTASVLQWAAGLARRLQAALTIIHTSGSEEAVPGYPCDGEWRRLVRRMAGDDIGALQSAAGSHAEVWLEPGSPLAAIPALAQNLRADLLVIGKSPRRRLFADLRTMSYDMVRRTPCPVASV